MPEREIPIVKANVTLLAELSHGRRGLNEGKYRPHIVIGPHSQRIATRDPNGKLYTERYLGVMFVAAPDAMEPGQNADVALALMYWPEEQSGEVTPGATFTIREGPLIVGFGTISAQRRGWMTLPLRKNS